jgi:UDP-N-acetylglucosamine acyltransferase
VIEIHPTAVVSPRAEIADGVVIGPLCVVGDDVAIGPRCALLGSCTVLGPTRMGEGNVVHPYAVLGGDPQDRSHAGESTRLDIGARNVFREHVTVHRGTTKDRGTTVVGDDGLFMAGVHVAHDAVIGDGVTFANGTLLGGHVVVGDRVTTGGRAAIAPFVRVGEGAFIAAGAMVEIDVPPFVIVAGDRARVRALNRVGLRRHGVPDGSRRALAAAFRALFGKRSTRIESVRAVPAELACDPYVQKLIGFLARSLPPEHTP